MPHKSHHVVPDSSGGWNIKKGGADRASAHTETKAKAIDVARIRRRDDFFYRIYITE